MDIALGRLGVLLDQRGSATDFFRADLVTRRGKMRWCYGRRFDGDEGPAVKAFGEAILVYLRALNTDLADQATA